MGTRDVCADTDIGFVRFDQPRHIVRVGLQQVELDFGITFGECLHWRQQRVAGVQMAGRQRA